MPRQLVWIIAALLILSLVLPLIAGTLMGGWGMGFPMMGQWWQDGRGAGWAWPLAMLLGMLGMVAFWAAVIVGGIVLLRWAFDRTEPRPGGTRENPLEILKQRYARGEIDQPTYERMRRELEQ